ncbi:MAG: type IV pilus twitching motility protein PilT [Campylobacterales bacterium]
MQVDVNNLTFEVTERVRGYLEKMAELGGSDLHLKANSKVRARVNGEIVDISDDEFPKQDAITFAKELLRTRFPELIEKKNLDLVYIYDDVTRYRVNIFFQMDGVSAVFRTIPDKKLTIDELGLPEAIRKFTSMQRGLVLVTGVTGSGKSTTLAAIIDEINRTQKRHIITIEDPIEFIHKDAECIINQRSVGQDALDFHSALKAALREDPDIILVGEMRDIETVEMALHAAETGHLVFSTLHTTDTSETINRIIGMFPPEEQNRIRITLATVLQGVVSQRLLKKESGGRIAALEILFKTPRIDALIRENRDSEIFDALKEGKGIYQTQTFDQAIYDLIKSQVIAEDEGLANATSPSDLKLQLSNTDASNTDIGTSKESFISIKRRD